MDPLIAKLERRFSPEFSRLLAKRLRNTPSGRVLQFRREFWRDDRHWLSDISVHGFVSRNQMIQAAEEGRWNFLSNP